jgi:cytochrome c2
MNAAELHQASDGQRLLHGCQMCYTMPYATNTKLGERPGTLSEKSF